MSRAGLEVGPSLEVLIPAAGASTRLGRPKQLIEVDGQPLIRRVVVLAASLEPAAIHVVLGARRELVEAELAGCEDTRVHYNADWASGMAGSLLAGLSQVHPDCPAVLVLLPDQAYIKASDLGRLVAAWEKTPDRPAAADYAGTFGAPAILPRTLFPRLRALTGDRGARAVLIDCGEALITVPMSSAAFDLDTPADERRLRRVADRP